MKNKKKKKIQNISKNHMFSFLLIFYFIRKILTKWINLTNKDKFKF